MSKITIAGTKEFMATFAPRAASLLEGDWLIVDDKTKVRIPDQVGIEISAVNGKTTIEFDQPLPIQAMRGWGPFQGTFAGTIEGVTNITAQGATLVLGGLPDQILSWEE